MLLRGRVMHSLRLVVLLLRDGAGGGQGDHPLVIHLGVHQRGRKRIHVGPGLLDFLRPRTGLQSRQRFGEARGLGAGLRQIGGIGNIIHRGDQIALVDSRAFLHQHGGDAAAVVEGRLHFANIHVTIERERRGVVRCFRAR